MKDILSEIIAHKQTEIELQKQTVSPEQLQEQAGIIIRENAAHRRSMKQALAASSTGIISEFKRRSPSKGWINEAARAEEIPASYEAAGAAALSILTDERFFGGTLRDIRTARPLVRIPILRKDFIIDEYQLLQACIVGADAVLLIAACLSPEQCSTLTAQAHELGLEVLLEIHSPSELSYINKEVDMVGVNNGASLAIIIFSLYLTVGSWPWWAAPAAAGRTWLRVAVPTWPPSRRLWRWPSLLSNKDSETVRRARAIRCGPWQSSCLHV